jgi:hypothetical protein
MEWVVFGEISLHSPLDTLQTQHGFAVREFHRGSSVSNSVIFMQMVFLANWHQLQQQTHE